VLPLGSGLVYLIDFFVKNEYPEFREALKKIVFGENGKGGHPFVEGSRPLNFFRRENSN